MKVKLTNTGERAGSETVQVYIKKVGDNGGPIKSLRHYAKVSLQPKESREITIPLKQSDFEWWDAQTNTMRYQPGDYEVWIGTSSRQSDLQSLTIKY